MKKIKFYWNIDDEPLKLGGLLMFRKAIENYLEFEELGFASLNFIKKNGCNSVDRLLIKNLFKDTEFKLEFLTEKNQEQKNPFKKDVNYFSTWYGIEAQINDNNGRQNIQWGICCDRSHANYITCHLSIPGPDEIKQIHHSQVREWIKFFQAEEDQNFMLLGDTPYPDEMVGLSNVTVAKNLDLNLNYQLALVSSSKLFLGSASGFASAAVLSETPFLVFKHPDHHPWEYITPTFLKFNQMQIRQLDNFENIVKGIKICRT